LWDDKKDTNRKTRKETQIIFYKVMAASILTGINKYKQNKNTEGEGIKFFRNMAG
jgi:hypothetical protein